MKYACIQRHRGRFPLGLMCRVLRVSRSGYYAWCQRPASPRAQVDQQLVSAIRAVHTASRRTYGSPRVQAELGAQGWHCGRHRVARLMRAAGLAGQRRRRWRVTTDSRHAHPVAANTLARQFAVARPNQVWAADLTYVPTDEGWIYLAVVLDLASRRVVGWAMQARLTQAVALDALQMALGQRRPSGGLLHHSDRGGQYASGAYQVLLARQGIQASMSRRGDVWDNAVVESFFATLKTELVHQRHYHSRLEARAELFDYIEIWYNRHRRHSALGYLSPAAFERQQFERQQVA